MSVFLYSEVNVICIFVLLVLLLRLAKSSDTRYETTIFSQIIIVSIGFILVDLFWGHISMGYVTKTKALLSTLNVVYYTLAGTLSCIWLYYSEIHLEAKWKKPGVRNCVFLIPALSVLIIMVISWFSGISFYIDDDMEYRRGSLYLMQILCAYYPLVVASARAFYYSRKKENYAMKDSLLTMASFPLFPLIFGLVQIFYNNVPILCVGIMMGILIVYLNGIDARISIDTLTQINNRNQFIRNLHHEMLDDKNNKTLYLYIIDADYFKEINDTYGHTEGDRALVHIAEVLKRVAAHYSCSIYRFGGDEFVMLNHVENDDDAYKIIDDIKDVTAKINEEYRLDYTLSLSVGFAKYNSSIETIPDYISIADEALYKVKKERHNARG